jgi:protein kinase C substrate 80K-H
MQFKIFLLLLPAFAELTGCLAHANVRGVHPSDISKYSATDYSSFACGDGSSISWERVNDDHCDCASGADEPGTSGQYGIAACSVLKSCLSIFRLF